MADEAPPEPNNALQDIDGNWSSKRVFAFVGLAALIASPHWVPPDNFKSIAWLTGIAIGGAIAEHFKGWHT